MHQEIKKVVKSGPALICVNVPEWMAVELVGLTRRGSPILEYKDLSALVTAILIDSRSRQGNLYSLLTDMERTLGGRGTSRMVRSRRPRASE